MTRRRYLIIGEAPAPDGGSYGLHYALARRALGWPKITEMAARSQQIRQMMRSEPDVYQFVLRCDHENVFQAWPGRSGQGSAFPMREARAAAERFFRDGTFEKYEATLIAGRRAAAALGLGREEPYWERRLCIDSIVVPHPSGLNRWWNESGNREIALRELRALGRAVE